MSAWKKVKAGAPELSEDEAIAIQSKEPNKYVAQLSNMLASIFSINVIFYILVIAVLIFKIPSFTDLYGAEIAYSKISTALSFILTLFFIFIYFKLYSSKNQLITNLGKNGLMLLFIITTLEIINIILIHTGLFNIYMYMYEWFLYITTTLIIIGFTLFAVGSNMPKAIKIAIISYTPIVFIIQFIMYIQFEDPQNSRIFYNSVLLITSAIYFIFIYTQTQKWKTNSIGH